MGEFQPLVELLQQVLPFAETVGEAALDSFAKAVGKRLGKEGDKTVANWARRLGTKLFEKLNPGELSPDSTDRGALEARLSKIAESDPDWARGIATLVQEGAQIGAIFIRDESQKIDANSVIAPRNFRDFIMPPAPTTAATPSRRHQLPADLADFTGREEEVERLEKLLGGKGGHAAISAIGGMGGVGKSALAIHVAHLLKDRYPDAQIVVELRGTSEQPKEPAEAMTEVIQAFHPEAQLPNDPAQLTQTYHSVLDGQRALILLDNAADAAQVRPLLPNPPVAAVVTSRRAIVLPGQQPINLDALPKAKARALLRSIVGPNRATDGELDKIADLCGRLPLALRAAGSFLAGHPDWSAAEYCEALADERGRLMRLKQDDLDVEASLGLSAAQLVQDKRDLAGRWQMLAVFPTSFDRKAVAAIWDIPATAAHDELSELVGRSLLLFDRDSGRYRLHDLMRAVAQDAFAYGGGKRDKAAEAKHLGRAAARHAGHYKAVLAEAGGLYLKGGEALMRGLGLFDAEWKNIQAGQAWAAAHAAEDDAVVSLCSEYSDVGAFVLGLRQHPRERIGWLETALAAARRLNDRGREAIHLGNLGISYEELGKFRRAIKYHTKALAIDREIGNRRGEGNDLGNLGIVYRRLRKPRRALKFFEQALAVHRGRGDRRGEGAALGNLGNTYADLGETCRAIEYYEQQLAITREIGDRRGEGNALFNSSLALHKSGDRTEAIAWAEAALEIYEQIKDPDAAKIRKKLAEWRGSN